MTENRFLLTGSPDARWTVVLAHGAVQGMDSPFMKAFAEGLSARGSGNATLRVARFEFPYMTAAGKEKKRWPPDREPVLLNAWRTALADLMSAGCSKHRLVVGGKSLGGRIASMIADEQEVAGLVCLGYPFHPPGRPDRLRTSHLQGIRAPTLICQGARDPFGTREEIDALELSPAIRFHWLEDGDHGFKPRKASGRTESDNWNSAMEAIVAFLGELP